MKDKSAPPGAPLPLPGEPAALFTALVVDDEELYAQTIRRELERAGIACEVAFNAREALHRCEKGRYQVILLDHHLRDDDGLRLIPLMLSRQHGASLMVMTAYQTIPNAVEAIRLGAEDYLVKETSLAPLVERVLELRRRAALRTQAASVGEASPVTLLGRSAPMQEVLSQLSKIAKAPETTVLILGETGVGKEVACRQLHAASRPEKSPLVVVDCLAMPEELAESLLFGHEKGAFPGAEQHRAGAFEESKDGTVFLDEIGDLSSALQGKLLRVLESRTFRRVGSSKDLPLRSRVVAAANRNLRELVEQNVFRQELFQRLSVFPLRIPPLRERGGEDILLLAEHFRCYFAEKLGKKVEPLSEAVAARLIEYDYPGNVRELRNIIERAAITAEASKIEVRHLPQRVLEASLRADATEPPLPFDFVPGIDTLSTLEQRMIKQAIHRAGGVRTEAARLLGISRYQLLRRMEKYGIKAEGGDEE